jgi:hypothetical protein
MVEKLKDLEPGMRLVIEKMMEAVGMTKRQRQQFRFVDLWYRQYTWTEADCAAFGDWFAAELKANAALRRELLRPHVRPTVKNMKAAWGDFNFMWGWSLGEATGKAPSHDD